MKYLFCCHQTLVWPRLLNSNLFLALSIFFCSLIIPVASFGESHKDSSSEKGILHLPERQKVVYHVSEAKKVPFVLGNINNHLDGVGGPDRVEIVVVVHGGGHNGFLKSKVSQEVATEVDLLQVQDVKFEMCGHTLDAYGTSVKDLVGDFTRLNQGGVVRMVELQMKGYAYLRP